VANVAALRAMIESARHKRDNRGIQTILFIDEIHRFNKAQQDVLLPYVEDGTVILIGATTHNPMFFVNAPLTSRSLVFELRPLAEASIVALLRRALSEERGLGGMKIEADPGALEHLARVSEGDARRALNALEIGALTTPPGKDGSVRFTRSVAADSIQKKVVAYDHDEDGHYDTISAFIKSVRGSDPDAAVYWLAKMLFAGEDPRFIARRLVILAAEDIGNADPRGLTVAVSAMHAAEFVGMPEARIILSQATTYLATAPKSNAAYLAVDKAEKDVQEGRAMQVPEHLRNLHLRTANGDARAEEYRYPHDYAGHFVPQDHVPDSARYYEPSDQGYEDVISRRLAKWRVARQSAPISTEGEQ
jgi:putative ATPase